MAMQKFNIAGYDGEGKSTILYTNVTSADLISLLNAEKTGIDQRFSTISVERIKDGLKPSIKVGTDIDWVSKFEKIFKLGSGRAIQYTHSFNIYLDIYNDKKTYSIYNVVYSQDTILKPNSPVIGSICDTMYEKRANLRVATIKVVDIATNKETKKTEKPVIIYSHVFYPYTVMTLPDMRGTGVRKVRNHTTKKEICTPVNFNTKKRTVVGGDTIYFANQSQIIDSLKIAIQIVRDHNKRK